MSHPPERTHFPRGASFLSILDHRFFFFCTYSIVLTNFSKVSALSFILSRIHLFVALLYFFARSVAMFTKKMNNASNNVSNWHLANKESLRTVRTHTWSIPLFEVWSLCYPLHTHERHDRCNAHIPRLGNGLFSTVLIILKSGCGAYNFQYAGTEHKGFSSARTCIWLQTTSSSVVKC